MQYEKAASVLSSHVPPLVLAKVDASEETNRELATQFEIKGFPTLKILRNGGKSVQEYKGPREADGIIEYLKKQSGPASVEIKSAEEASNLIGDKKIVIVSEALLALHLILSIIFLEFAWFKLCIIFLQVGVFPKLSGQEFENYLAFAEKLRSDYDFGHTLDAKHLPRGESSLTGPLVRLFKPFDELFVDFKVLNISMLLLGTCIAFIY